MFLLPSQTLYLRIRSRQLAICHVQSGTQLVDEPVVALSQHGKQSQIVAIGHDAVALGDSLQWSLVNPFSHPRTLLADFALAEKVLAYFIARVRPRRWWPQPFTLILHPQDKLEGGLTQIELRALHELGLGAGASKVQIWTGADLSATDLLSATFPGELGELHPV